MGKRVQIALCLDKMCLEARTGNQMTLVVSQGGDNGGRRTEEGNRNQTMVTKEVSGGWIN